MSFRANGLNIVLFLWFVISLLAEILRNDGEILDIGDESSVVLVLIVEYSLGGVVGEFNF